MRRSRSQPDGSRPRPRPGRAVVLGLVLLAAAAALAQEGAPEPAPPGTPAPAPAVPPPPAPLVVRTGHEGARVRLVGLDVLEMGPGAWTGLLDPGRLLETGATVAGDAGVARLELEAPADGLLLAGGEGLAPALIARNGPFLQGETVEAALRPAARQAGRVRDAEGKPVAGAEVLWLEEPPGNLLAEAPPLLGFRARTSDEGAFEREGLPRGPFLLVVRAGERGALLLANVWCEEDPLDLRLPAPGSLAGTVRVEPDGAPQAGALVRLVPGPASPFDDPRQARTDEEGRWRIGGLPEAGFRLEVEAPGFLDLDPREVVPRAGEERVGLDVTLRARGGLAGRVLTVATDPVAGAEIFLRYPPTETDVKLPDPFVPVATTGPDGAFRVEGLPPEAQLAVGVRAPGYAPVVLTDVAVPGGDPRELPPVLLRRGGSLRGKVVAAESPEAPLAGAWVAAVPEDEDALTVIATELSWRARYAETAEDGTFLLEGLSPGGYRVAAVRPDRLPALSAPIAVEGERTAGTELDLVLPLRPGARISGRVVDREGRPVGDAVVTLTPHGGGPGRRETATAADGSFSLPGLPDAAQDVAAAAPGYAEARREAVTPGSKVDLVLRTPGAVAGRVRVEEGETVPPFSLAALVRRPDEGDEPRFEPVFLGRFRAPDGSFRVDGLPPGIYRLEAELLGGRTGAVEGVVVPEGGVAEDVEIGTAACATLEGRVLDGVTGRPAEGAVVAALSPGSDAARATAVADPDGLYRLEGVAPGAVTLVVEARDRAPARVEGLRAHPGIVQRLDDIVVTPGASLRIEAKGRSGGPLAGVELVLERPDAPGRRSAFTDVEGVAEFDLLTPGSYRVWRGGEEGTASVWIVRVDEGERADLVLDLTETVRLAGAVLRAGLPVGGVRIEALLLPPEEDLRLGRRVFRTTADASGRYVLDGIPPGDYVLRVAGAAAGSAALLLPAVVPAAPDHRLDLELPEESLLVRIEDDADGRPREGVPVVVRRAGGGVRGLLERLDAEVARGRTGPGGLLEVSGLGPGRYRVEAHPEGRGQAVAEAAVAPRAGPVEVRLRVPAEGVVTGVVQDLRQEPLAGASLQVRDAAGRLATPTPRVRVGTDGRFRLAGLAPGRYRIVAEAPGYARDTRWSVEVVPGGELDLRFLLEEEGRLLVTVYGPGGVPLRGAEVAVLDAFDHLVWPPPLEPDLYGRAGEEGLTDARGQARVRSLPAGIHVVRARFPGLPPSGTRVRIQSGAEVPAAVVLRPE